MVFQCPACKAYEQQIGPTIDQLVTDGQAKIVYHPVAYLDRFSSTQYSTRSSQASACAPDAASSRDT
ncbi:DsbA family protein [Pseudonocardia sp. T1-2H]|uniref:DsbA family protein n=1 Tax=Pseudonocardia sp. T1-2H TaxID=3128899 RepID=UPI003101584D